MNEAKLLAEFKESRARQERKQSISEENLLAEFREKKKKRNIAEAAAAWGKIQPEIPEKYKSNLEAEDFSEKSKAPENSFGSYMNLMRGTDSPQSDSQAIYRNFWINGEDGLKRYRNALGSGYFQNNAQYEEMVDEERAMYNYVFNTQGPAAGEEYLREMESTLRARQLASQQKEYEARSDKGTWGKIGLSAESVYNRLVGGVEGIVNLGRGWFSDEEIDANPYYNTTADMQRAAVSKDWNGVGSFAYNTAMSGVDMIVALLTSKGIGKAVGGGSKLVSGISAGIMGSEAGASTLAEAKRRGYSDNEAAILGILSAGIEWGTEKVSLDALLKTDNLKRSVKGYLLYAAKNAGVEASEEASAEILNAMADYAVTHMFGNGDSSKFSESVKKSLESGMSVEEAVEKYFWEVAKDVGVSAAGGALLGGVLGSGNIALSEIFGARAKGKSSKASGELILKYEGAGELLLDAADASENEGIIKLAKAAREAKAGSEVQYKKYGELASALYAEAMKRTEGLYGSTELTDEQRATLESFYATDFGKSIQSYDAWHAAGEEEMIARAQRLTEAKKGGESLTPEQRYKGEVLEAYNEGLKGYSGKPEVYAYYFARVRQLGMTAEGRSVSEMIKTLDSAEYEGLLSLDNETLLAAFNAGKEYMAAIDAREAEIEAKKKKASEREAGTEEHNNENTEADNENTENNNASTNFHIDKSVKTDGLTETQKKGVENIKRAAELLPGFNFIVVDDPTDSWNGRFVGKTNSIYVNIHARRHSEFDFFDYALTEALTHETVHGIRENAPKLYEELRRFIKTEIYSKESYEQLVKRRYEQYEKRGEPVDYEYAEEEVMANALENMLGKERVMQKLAGEHKSLFSRIWRSIKNFFEKLFKRARETDRFSRKTVESDLLTTAAEGKQKKLEDMFVKALRTASENADALRRAGVEGRDTVRYSFIGRTADGRGIYRSNYPENTSKDIKQKDIVELVQNVWSKKPIKLNLVVNGKDVPIEARFNPELTERSDLSKIAFGNRKGTASEKRITMNLSSDIYQIAEESHHVGSKTESGKDNAAHVGVTTWHYFLTNLVYMETDGTEIECYMNIDVKQNDSGNWFYSFAIEKGSRPADVLSVVTDKSATTSTISITENTKKINPSAKKSLKIPSEAREVLSEKYSAQSLKTDGEGDIINSGEVLTEEEIASILAYKSGGSYSLNAKLRDGIELNSYEKRIVNGIDSALEKLPVYKGKVYRNISFDGFGDKAARDEYVAGHIVGEYICHRTYISSSTKIDGYPIDGSFVVRHIIQSVNGKNLAGYGNNSESEILFPRESEYLTEKIIYDTDGTPTIYLTEVAYEQGAISEGKTRGDISGYSRGQQKASAESYKTKVQRLSAQNTEDGEMQSVSERNPEGYFDESSGVPGVRAEINGSEDSDIRYSISDEYLSREVLAEAAENIAETDAEREVVRQYREKLFEIDDMLDKRRRLEARLRELEGMKGMATERQKITNNIKTLTDSISRRDEKLLTLRNAKPLQDVVERYKKKAYERRAKAAPGSVTMSRGEILRERAKYTHERVYSKADARALVDEASRRSIRGAKREALIDEIWQGLNGSETEAERVEFIRTMSDKILDGVIDEETEKNPQYEQDAELSSYVRQYVGGLAFSEDLKEEVKHRLDVDGAKAFFGRWGNKRSDRAPTPADVFVTEFARENPGYEYLENMHPAEALFEIDELYRRVSKSKPYISRYDNISAEERAAMKGEIVDLFLKAFREGGEISVPAREVVKARAGAAQKAADLDKARREFSRKYRETRDYYKATLALDRIARSIRDKKLGAFENATEIRGSELTGLLRDLSAFEYRKTFSPNDVREKVKGLLSWYSKDNPILGYESVSSTGEYISGIEDMLKNLTLGEGAFSAAELYELGDVLTYFVHFAEHYNKVWYNGKWEDAVEVAKRYIDRMELAESLKNNETRRIGFFRFIRKYLDNYSDPLSVVRRYDSYIEDGFYTETFRMLERSAVGIATSEARVLERYYDFLKKNPDYLRRAQTEFVTLYGHRVPKLQAISIYMTTRQSHAQAGFVYNGFEYTDFSGRQKKVQNEVELVTLEFMKEVRAENMAKERGISKDEAYKQLEALGANKLGKFLESEAGNYLSPEEIASIAEAHRAEMAKSFTEKDKELMRIAEEVMTGELRDMKRETDMQRLGFSNVFEGYYFPIYRSGTAQKIETQAYRDELASVSNISANKERIKGAKQTLLAVDVTKVLTRHARAICTYANMQNTVDFYDKVFNVDTSGDKNRAVNLKAASERVWGTRKNAKGATVERSANDYFKELIEDIQGLRHSREGFLNGIIAPIRSGMVIAALGLNAKVLFSQLSSYGAAMHVLDFKALVQGVGRVAKRVKLGGAVLTPDGRAALSEFGAEVDKYCPLAKVRAQDNHAYLAQGVVEKKDGSVKMSRAVETFEKGKEVIMLPIGAVDRAVVCGLFEACKIQVESETGKAYGTEENLTAAGELLERVILDTQQNSLATEKSAAMRSESEIEKSLTMFSSDAMKTFGRFLDAWGELIVLRKRLAHESDPAVREALLKRRGNVVKNVVKSSTVLFSNAVYMTAIGLLFSFLRGKLDDDEDVWKSALTDFGGNLFGGLPVARDLYSLFLDGYDLSYYAFDVVNDFASGVSSLMKVAGKLVTGEAEVSDLMRALKKLLFSFSQLAGVPLRNVYNAVYGFIKMISKEAAAKMDAFFGKR